MKVRYRFFYLLLWILMMSRSAGDEPFPTPKKTDNEHFNVAKKHCYSEVSIWGGKRNGQKELIECCMGIMMGVCMKNKCRKEPLKSMAHNLCAQEMFDVPPGCEKHTHQECAAMKAAWVWILIIVVVAIVIVALLSLIFLVFYRKFYKAGRPKGKIKFKWAGKANVDTHGGKREKKKKGSSSSKVASKLASKPDSRVSSAMSGSNA